MDRALAKHIVATAFRSASQISSLMPVLKQHCTEEEYRPLAIAIAKASAGITMELIDRLYSMYPDLEAEVERDIQAYERVL